MLQKTLLKIIKLYQRLVSPLSKPRCRFLPTCSEYSALAVEKHGFAKGTALSFWRVLRCNPLGKGGADLP